MLIANTSAVENCLAISVVPVPEKTENLDVEINRKIGTHLEDITVKILKRKNFFLSPLRATKGRIIKC